MEGYWTKQYALTWLLEKCEDAKSFEKNLGLHCENKGAGFTGKSFKAGAGVLLCNSFEKVENEFTDVFTDEWKK